jgi:hypothetical protein
MEKMERKIKLTPFEVELAFENSTRRYISNLKQGKGFSYGYTGGFEKTITDSVLGSLGEIAYAKATNTFFNNSYSDSYARYTDSDFQNNIEIRTQNKQNYNFLLIRPDEKKGKYVLVIHEGTNRTEKLKFNFSIMGWFPFYKEMPERLSDFGHPNRPAAYKVEVKELYDINKIKKI